MAAHGTRLALAPLALLLVMYAALCITPAVAVGPCSAEEMQVVVEDGTAGEFYMTCLHAIPENRQVWTASAYGSTDGTTFASMQNAFTHMPAARTVYTFATRDNACVVRKVTAEPGAIGVQELLTAPPSLGGLLEPCHNASSIVSFSVGTPGSAYEGSFLLLTALGSTAHIWQLTPLESNASRLSAKLLVKIPVQSKVTAGALDTLYQVYYVADRVGTVTQVSLAGGPGAPGFGHLNPTTYPNALIRELWYDAGLEAMMAWLTVNGEVAPAPAPLHTAAFSAGPAGAAPAGPNSTWSVATLGKTVHPIMNVTAWLTVHSPVARMRASQPGQHAFWQFLPDRSVLQFRYVDGVMNRYALQEGAEVPWTQGGDLNLFAM